MTIPKQAPVWDDRRNTSRTRPPEPGAADRAIKAVAQFRRDQPALYRWIVEGHPNLTEAEHVERFGKEWKR